MERVERLLTLVNSPQTRIPAIHIAGTKGKGSTSAILDSILRKANVRTGLFTSPHIEVFEERMKVNGVMPSPDQLVAMVAELDEALRMAPDEIVEDGPTYFEVATLLAWKFFEQQQVDVVILETGLGGRLDCTNVCSPLVTIITTIGLDHTHILGDTLPKIAAEKAGIIKPSVPVFTWALQPEVLEVIHDHADRAGCDVFEGEKHIRLIAAGEGNNGDEDTGQGEANQFSVTTPWKNHRDLMLPLRGAHQLRNASLAIAAADCLGATSRRSESDCPSSLQGIDSNAIAEGIRTVLWPLRFEIHAGFPDIVLDAAHNPDSIMALLETLEDFAPVLQRKRVLVFASSSDKDAKAMLNVIVPAFDEVVFTSFTRNPRAIKPADLLDLVESLSLQTRTSAKPLTIETPEGALRQARLLAGDDGIVCGTGSIFLSAELKSVLES